MNPRPTPIHADPPDATGIGHSAPLQGVSTAAGEGTVGGVISHEAPLRTAQVYGNEQGMVVHDAQSEGEDTEDAEEDDSEGDEEDIPETENIRDDLEEIFSSKLEFSGTFAVSKTYPTAPNPAIFVDNLGTVGLPLSIRDAEAIKSCSVQAPFGMADQTVVDKSVRNTWEIDGSKVKFENAAWATFMDETLRTVCVALGVNFSASKPRCDLYKLLLYEQGSHFLPHVDTEKVDGMFATIVIVLPSRFTGGTVCVSHGDLNSTFEHCANSLTQTTVLAWYTDVEHQVKAVTSGYRLALSFNLIHTTNALRPALASHTAVSRRLQRILLSWKQAEQNAPDKIIYVLAHKYSHANLSGSALKGLDAHLVALLENVGQPLGFGMGLANLTCTETGIAVDNGGGCGYGRRGRYGRYDDDDDDDVYMEEVESRSVQIEHLVDISGHLIQAKLDFRNETKTIPSDLVESITADGNYDNQEYEGYMGNWAGSLERFYRRTVLVMWPQWAQFDLVHGANGFVYACKKLATSITSVATQEEAELSRIILVRASPTQSKAVVKSVCHVALAWRDLPLWFEAVKACDAERSLAALREDNIYRALETFGTEEILPCLERTLEKDPSNTASLQFLDKCEKWFSERYPDRYASTVKAWVSAQRSKRFGALAKPTPGEHTTLIGLALQHGGPEFLEASFLPQIKLLADGSELLDYASCLFAEKSIPEDTRGRLSKDIFAFALANIEVYPPAPAPPPPTYPIYGRQAQPSAEVKHLEIAKALIKACFDLNCDDLFPTIVEKLLLSDGLATDMLRRRVKNVLLPLIAHVEGLFKGRGGRRPDGLQKLCLTVATRYLDSLAANSQHFDQIELSRMMQAVVTGGQPEMLLSTVVPKLEALKLDTTQLQSLMDELHAKRAVIDPTNTNIPTILLRLLKKWSGSVNLTATQPSYPHIYGIHTTAPVQQKKKPAISAFDYCLSLKLPDACTFISKRLLSSSNVNTDYIKKQLVPLVPDLRALLAKYDIPPTSPVFAALFRAIALLYVEKVLGKRPSSDALTRHVQAMARWTCACAVCPAVRRFLTTEAEEAKQWSRIGAPTRKHVEAYLAIHARPAATWETIRSTPQGLQVRKAKAIIDPLRWQQAQEAGTALLRQISSAPAELATILGPDHARVLAFLQGRPPPPPGPAPSTSAVPPAATGVRPGPVVAAAAAASTAAGEAAGPNTLAPARVDAHAHAHAHARGPGAAPGAQAQATTDAASARAAGTGAQPRVAPGTRPAGASGEPPAKRRKTAYDERDVIDLT